MTSPLEATKPRRSHLLTFLLDAKIQVESNQSISKFYTQVLYFVAMSEMENKTHSHVGLLQVTK